MKIAGLDLSPNSSGVTVFDVNKSLEVVKTDYMGFTTVKKNECQNVHFYHDKKSFNNNVEKYVWMHDLILEKLKDVEYVAIEDYAYAGIGKVFNIAEFAGSLKEMLYRNNMKIRLYDPTSIKMYFTSRGDADKISMSDKYDSFTCNYKHKLNHLPKVTNPKGNSPTSDIIDSFVICDLLLLELKLRSGLVLLKDLQTHEIKLMNRVTTTHPVNILAQEFIGK
jgi:Holliday junction resolvasome RuvABC endonuclease subunit